MNNKINALYKQDNYEECIKYKDRALALDPKKNKYWKEKIKP